MGHAPRRALLELKCAVLESQNPTQLQERTEPLLMKLFRADHVAFCRMHPDLPTGFEWRASTTGHFLQSYYQWYEADFVFRWLTRNPNTAASDLDMLRGQKVEETETYRRSRQAQLHLRRVLAVLMAPEHQVGSGAVALYKERDRAFSAEDQRVLQELTPALSGAFQNFARFGALSTYTQLLEALLRQEGTAAIVLEVPRREFFRTDAVTPLLERWFPSRSERDEAGIPRAWSARMNAFMADGSPRTPVTWWEKQGTRSLEVSLLRLPRIEGRDFWELRLKEFHVVPEKWKLSPRQRETAALIIEGLSNKEIASKLGITQNTANDHVDAVYAKLKVSSRTELTALASRP